MAPAVGHPRSGTRGHACLSLKTPDFAAGGGVARPREANRCALSVHRSCVWGRASSAGKDARRHPAVLRRAASSAPGAPWWRKIHRDRPDYGTWPGPHARRGRVGGGRAGWAIRVSALPTRRSPRRTGRLISLTRRGHWRGRSTRRLLLCARRWRSLAAWWTQINGAYCYNTAAVHRSRLTVVVME